MIEIELPNNWQWVELGDECKFTQGIQVDIKKQKFEKFENCVQFLRIIDFTQSSEPPRYIENPGERYLLNKDEIAMVRYGTVGYVCVNKTGAIANNLFKIIPSEKIFSKFLIYFFNSYLFKSKLETKGATMQALSFGLIKPIKFPLPSLETQQVIVSKIEELFSELDQGIADLKTAQAQLKVYRQSVLKHAFEGKLTNKNVKEGELPEGWEILKIKDICEIKGGKNQSKVINPNGKYPIYGSSGIFGYADEYICDENTTIIGRKGNINSPLYVTTKFWNVDTAFGLCANEKYDSKLLFYFCLGFNFKKLDKSTTIPSLAKSDILSIDIQVPSLEEQHHIVQEIESRLSVADKMEESIQESLQKAEALRQSILKKAFSGELV